MMWEALARIDRPNQCDKLIMESMGPADTELLTHIAAALEHGRCIRVFKTDDEEGPHYMYKPGTLVEFGYGEESPENG